MNKIHNAILMLPLVGALVLGGCDESLTVAEGGIGGTGISTGTVTGIGSIKVNGVTFNTDSAAVYIEGIRVDDPDLPDGTGAFLLAEGFSEGQVVRVIGSFNADGRTGTADAVYYNDSIEGPIESVTQIDATTLRLQIMSQSVIVYSQTLLEGTTLTNIGNAGHDHIEVSGLRDANGEIRAGYIRNTNISDPDGSSLDEIKGVIDSVSAPDMQFTINGLIVDYSNLPAFTPQGNVQVEVKGDYVGGQLVATSIELDDDVDGSDNDEVEYEGIVMSDPLPSLNGIAFMLGTKNVQTNLNTVYKSGLAADIITGVHLEVEGYLQSGILIADEVRFRDSTKIDAQINNYTTTGANDSVTITLTGLAGINILVNELSNIEVNNLSGASNDLSSLIDALGSGDTDYVKVRGRCLNCEDLSALEQDVYAEEIKLENDSNEQEVKLQGPVVSINEPFVTVLGVSIDTTTVSGFDSPQKRATFFATLMPGNIVSAEGVLSGSIIDWDNLELEDEE